MFVTFNMGNYEEDSIGQKLRYLDMASEDDHYYGTLERYTHHYDPNTSLYGRQINREIKSVGKFIKDIEKEIKEAKKRIEYYVDSGRAGGQRETELRNTVQQYYKMKLDGVKIRASLLREVDKSKKEDIKLLKDIYGKVDNTTALAQSVGDDRSSDRAFMSGMLSGGVDSFFNNSSNLYTATPNQTFAAPTPQPVTNTVTNVMPEQQPLPTNPLQEMSTNIEANNVVNNIPQPVEQPVVQQQQPIEQNNFPNTHGDNLFDDNTPNFEIQPSVEENGKKIVSYIKNANGEDVPIYDDGPDDFITGKKTYTDAKLAYDNITLKLDPNVERVFKFNEDEGMGWLAYYDMNSKKEIKDKGSLRNIEQIFPFEVDKENNLVTTVLRETYPVIYTNEEPSEEVKSEYERLEKIEESKKERRQ